MKPSAYDETAMRTLKLLMAVLVAFVGAWLLILTRGIFVAIEGADPDWYPVPSYPVARITMYVTIAIGLQFLSAWLLMPTSPERGAAYGRRYAARVALCICGCFYAIGVLLFVALIFCSDC